MNTACLTVSVVNFSPIWGNKASNLSAILGYSEAATKQGSSMILFPQLALTGFGPKIFAQRRAALKELAEPLDGKSIKRVADLSQALGIYIAFGMPLLEGGKLYNALVVCGPMGLVGYGGQLHIQDGHWADMCEKLPFYFETEYGRIMTGLGYDSYYFPEVYRYAKGKNVQLYLNAAANFEKKRNLAHQVILNRAVGLNTLPVATANLTGICEDCTFTGGSHILAPGEPIEQAYVVAGHRPGEIGAEEEGLYTSVLDMSATVTMPHYPYFEYNQKVGSPDWRPDKYLPLYRGLCNDRKEK